MFHDMLGKAPVAPADAEDLIDVPFVVFAEEHGLRADVFLSQRIKRMSRSKAAHLIRAGSVRMADGRVIDRPAARVWVGERVLLRRKPLDEAPIDDIELLVAFEDDEILAVNKPGDLVVHPTASAYHRTVIRVLRTRQPNQYFELAHRIDKETSGLLILSKDARTDAFLKAQFEQRRVKKSYLAIVRGCPKSDRFTIDAPMRLSSTARSGVRMEIGGRDALDAVTDVEVKLRGDEVSLVEARPHTGRQHQIRLHLAHVGHPILGDKLYLGGDDVFLRALRERPDRDQLTSWLGHWRHALHAHTATLTHPRTLATIELRAELSPDLVALVRAFGWDG